MFHDVITKNIRVVKIEMQQCEVSHTGNSQKADVVGRNFAKASNLQGLYISSIAQ